MYTEFNQDNQPISMSHCHKIPYKVKQTAVVQLSTNGINVKNKVLILAATLFSLLDIFFA
jgi:hypothetical protein